MQVASRYLTPPEIAKRYGVDEHKVHHWIQTGELPAVNVATNTGGRPRYRISPSDLAIFELARTVGPQVKAVRRRRKDPLIHEFF
jgi:excisionase family DNA binding protein